MSRKQGHFLYNRRGTVQNKKSRMVGGKIGVEQDGGRWLSMSQKESDRGKRGKDSRG